MGSRAMKRRYGVRKKNKKVVFLSILAVFLAVVAACCIGAFALCQSWLKDLPDYSGLDSLNKTSTSTVYASDGTTVLAEFQLENRDPVSINDISDYVLEATVATEDERFYNHDGVDMLGVARATINNLMGGDLEGASTITQQLVRNTILSDEMSDISFKRKIREMYIALQIEKEYSKEDILLMYLNTINYGSGAYGIEAAAQRYFSKSADELTLSESAALVGIPQSPTYNNPIDNYDACVERRDLVLDRMVSNGYITQEECDAAKDETLELNVSDTSTTGILQYEYFTSYVRNQLLSEDAYGFTTADIFQGGWTIYTTLDVDVQEAAEEAAQNKIDEVGDTYEVSLVAIDPDNGCIRALIGGTDYDADQVNMATGEGGSGRQSGSSFKTFTLLAAIEAGIDPDTLIDAGSTLEVTGSTDISNINNKDYGIRSIRRAFWVSSNTAFARLALSVGVDEVIDMAQRCGIESELSEVVGVTLGVDSVTPLEMADAYATIANGGTHYDAECIERIVDADGNVIVDNSNPEGERVISEEVAVAAIDVMEGVVTSGTGTAAQLSTGQVAAGKTGTTDDSMDSWFCGITPQYSVAIWLGDRRGYTEGVAVTGSAASAFSDFLDTVLADAELEDFPEADEPDYDEDYRDAENHIGIYSYSSSYSSGSSSGTSASSSSSAATTTGTTGDDMADTESGVDATDTANAADTTATDNGDGGDDGGVADGDAADSGG